MALPLAAPAQAGVAPSPGAADRTATASRQPATPDIELLEQTTWHRQGDGFSATIEVEDAPPDATLTMSTYRGLSNRNDLNEILEQGIGSAVPRRTPFLAVPISDLPAVGNAIRLDVPVDELGLTALGEDLGVFPVQIAISDAAGTPLASLVTYLVLLPEWEAPPLTVATVMEIGAPTALQPDGTTEIGTDDLRIVRQHARAVAETQAPLSIAPVPETIDGLSRLDSPLLDTVQGAATGKQILARPYVDLDLDAFDRDGLLGTVPLEADAGANVIRTQFEREPAPNVWLTGSSISPTEISAWHDLGVTAAVLPTEAVAEVAGNEESISPPVQLPGGMPAFVSDDALVDRLVNAEDQQDVQEVLAELAIIWAERPSDARALALRVPPQAGLDPDLVAEALDELHASPVIKPVTATELFATHGPGTEGWEPATAELNPKTSAKDLRWMATRLGTAWDDVDGLDQVLGDGDLTASLKSSLLIAPGASTEEEDREAHLERAENSADEVAEGIGADDGFRITLTSRDSTIPLTISNDLDQEVRVRVQLRASQLEFPDGAIFEQTVPPGGTRIDLPVRTRTSGAFPLRVTITSVDGQLLLDEADFNIRSTTISGLGLVLTAGAGLFLIVWWARHWRSSRRESAAPAE